MEKGKRRRENVSGMEGGNYRGRELGRMEREGGSERERETL